MAVNAKSIKTAPNAFEYSSGVLTIPAGGAETVTDALLATTNSTGMTFVIDVLNQAVADDVKYKMQMTCATIEEVNKGLIENSLTVNTPWHDWDVPGMDVNNFLSDVQFDWWIPIPSAVRMVIKNDNVSTAATFYWAVRGQ